MTLRRFREGLADIAPVGVAVAAMLIVFVVVAVAVPASSLRDGLLGSIVGGFVTLIATLAAQELQARSERRRRAEEDARAEIRAAAPVARELAEISAYITAMTEGPSAGHLELLSHRAWDQLEVELGMHLHPHEVAELSVTYHQLKMTNQILLELGAPADGSSMRQPIALDLEVVAYLSGMRERALAGLKLLNRRGDTLQRRFGWPATPPNNP